ncbi:hypothetical protein [Limosilactobacillus difficilis]|uniref:hypothetical protein n=1 Tax=Limosilactobacillus difficilis TaxID=2991838 RepID=UPI0024BADF3B|nr:hypothetical protein [Limosilactobacillus difficilis]
MSMNDLLTAKQQEVLHSYLSGDSKMMILTGAIRSGKIFIDNLPFYMSCGERQIWLKSEANCTHNTFLLALRLVQSKTT